MIDRPNIFPAGCLALLTMSAITVTAQAEAELEFSYSDEWSVVSAPPPSGPYRAVHVDPRVPGQGVTPPVTTAFDADKQADLAGTSPQPEAGSEVVQQAVDTAAGGKDQAATPSTVEVPGATVAAEEMVQSPSSVVTATEEIQDTTSDMQTLPGQAAADVVPATAPVMEQAATPVIVEAPEAAVAAGAEGRVQQPPVATTTPDTASGDTRSVQATTARPPAAAITARPAAPSSQPPAGHAGADIPDDDTPIASQFPIPGMMPPPAAGHPVIRQPAPRAAAGDDVPVDMPPPVPGQYGQMRPDEPAYDYPQSGRQGGGYPQSGWQGGGYTQSGRRGGSYPQSGRQDGGYPQSGWQGGGYPQSGWQRGGYPQSGWQGGGYPGHMNTSPYGYSRGPADISGTEVPPPAEYQAPPYYGGNAYPVR